MTATLPHRIAPPPPPGPPAVRFHVGLRVSDLLDMPGGPRRLVGDVVDSNTWLFSVRWTGGEGTARYAHTHEPHTLRPATAADEDATGDRRDRCAAVAELRRQMRQHPLWPVEVRDALRARIADLTAHDHTPEEGRS